MKPPGRLWSELFRNRNLQLITFAYAGLGYFQYIFFYWIYYYFGQVRHLDANESAGYTTILFVTEGVMMPLGGFISDRITRRTARNWSARGTDGGAHTQCRMYLPGRH